MILWNLRLGGAKYLYYNECIVCPIDGAFCVLQCQSFSRCNWLWSSWIPPRIKSHTTSLLKRPLQTRLRASRWTRNPHSLIRVSEEPIFSCRSRVTSICLAQRNSRSIQWLGLYFFWKFFWFLWESKYLHIEYKSVHIIVNFSCSNLFQRVSVAAPPDPSTLIFSASPSFGIGLSTQFTLKCSGGNALSLPPLRYSIGFALTPLTGITEGVTLAQNCFWMVDAGMTLLIRVIKINDQMNTS